MGGARPSAYGFQTKAKRPDSRFSLTAIEVVRLFKGDRRKWISQAQFEAIYANTIKPEDAKEAYHRDFRKQPERLRPDIGPPRRSLQEQIQIGRSRLIQAALARKVAIGIIVKRGTGKDCEYRLDCWFCSLCGHIQRRNNKPPKSFVCQDCLEAFKDATAHGSAARQKNNSLNEKGGKATD